MTLTDVELVWLINNNPKQAQVYAASYAKMRAIISDTRRNFSVMDLKGPTKAQVKRLEQLTPEVREGLASFILDLGERTVETKRKRISSAALS